MTAGSRPVCREHPRCAITLGFNTCTCDRFDDQAERLCEMAQGLVDHGYVDDLKTAVAALEAALHSSPKPLRRRGPYSPPVVP